MSEKVLRETKLTHKKLRKRNQTHTLTKTKTQSKYLTFADSISFSHLQFPLFSIYTFRFLLNSQSWFSPINGVVVFFFYRDWFESRFVVFSVGSVIPIISRWVCRSLIRLQLETSLRKLRNELLFSSFVSLDSPISCHVSLFLFNQFSWILL